jgi:hypothetical protein
MPVLRLFGGTVVTSRSPKRTLPAVGSRKPAIMRSSVVLPHPDGPSRKNSSPLCTARSTASTAVVRPKRLVTPRRVIAVMAAAA